MAALRLVMIVPSTVAAWYALPMTVHRPLARASDEAEPRPASPAAVARADNPLHGILLNVGAMMIFACSDATAKFLMESLPAVEIAWMRYAVFVVLVAPAVIRRPTKTLRSARPGLQAVRSIALLGSSIFFIMGVGSLPMADATATTFVSPLFTTALSIPFLGEQVGVRRWSAIVIGLVGVLIVVRPGTSAFNPASIFPILSAMSWSAALVITRKQSGADGTVTMLAYSAGIGFALLSVALPFIWVPLTWQQITLGLFIGLASSAGQWLIVLAYHRANASVLAPFSYTQIVWSSLTGYFIFAAIPDEFTFLGAGIIVASGLYTAHRERVVARKRGH
jgi:drug/metabolite transporter (DMT)-like permease